MIGSTLPVGGTAPSSDTNACQVHLDISGSTEDGVPSRASRLRRLQDAPAKTTSMQCSGPYSNDRTDTKERVATVCS